MDLKAVAPFLEIALDTRHFNNLHIYKLNLHCLMHRSSEDAACGRHFTLRHRRYVGG